MKKLLFASLLLFLVTLTSCNANSTATTASPSKTTASVPVTVVPTKSPAAIQIPSVTAKPTPKQAIKLTNEAANAHLKIIEGVLATQSNYKDFGQDYSEQMYSGALFDLDSDGQDELILAFPTDNGKYYYYEIYTYKLGNSVLLKRDKLFVNAGLEGGLSIVSYNGERYLCVWNVDTHPADTGLYTEYKYALFTNKDSALKSMHTFSFTYLYLKTKDKKLPLDNKPGLFKDGNEISLDEFLKTQDAFENPVNVLCKVGKTEPPYRLRQLYEDILNR